MPYRLPKAIIITLGFVLTALLMALLVISSSSASVLYTKKNCLPPEECG